MPRSAFDICDDRSGATMVEYALLLGLIAAVLVVAIPPLVALFIDAFNRLSEVYRSATP